MKTKNIQTSARAPALPRSGRCTAAPSAAEAAPATVPPPPVPGFRALRPAPSAQRAGRRGPRLGRARASGAAAWRRKRLRSALYGRRAGTSTAMAEGEEAPPPPGSWWVVGVCVCSLPSVAGTSRERPERPARRRCPPGTRRARAVCGVALGARRELPANAAGARWLRVPGEEGARQNTGEARAVPSLKPAACSSVKWQL